VSPHEGAGLSGKPGWLGGGLKKDPRPYQRAAIEGAREAYRQGKRAILLVCPTGGGKTFVGARIVEGAVGKAAAGEVVFWIAHREELLLQAQKSIMAEGIEDVGIIAPWARRQHAKVQVTSIQTLAAQIKAGREIPRPRLMVIDEAHHFATTAPGWYEVIQRLKAPTILGLTATPERGDGAPMGDIFDHLIPVSSVRELQELGVLVPCVTYAPETTTKALVREPIDAYREHGWGERCFVFCVTVAHAEAVAESFRSAGVNAATIHADTPWELRRARLAAFQSQDATPLRKAGSADDAPLVLTCVYTLTEGVDVPEATVCITARGIGHGGMMRQMVGRILRAAPWAGKTRGIWWDLRGQSNKPGIGLPEADCTYSLEGKAITVSESTPDDPPRRCKVCQATFMTWAVDRKTGGRRCPGCGEPAPQLEMPNIAEREVFAVGSGAPEEARNEALDRLCIEAVEKGRKRGWIMHRHRELYQRELDWKALDESLLRARTLLGVRAAPAEVVAERERLEAIAAERRIPQSWVERKLREKFGDGGGGRGGQTA